MNFNTRPNDRYALPALAPSQHDIPVAVAECLTVMKHAYCRIETLLTHQYGPGVPGPRPGVPQGYPYPLRAFPAGGILIYGVQPKKNQRPCHGCRTRRKKCNLISFFPYLCKRCSDMGLHACPLPNHVSNLNVAVNKPVKTEPKDGDFMDKHLPGTEGNCA